MLCGMPPLLCSLLLPAIVSSVLLGESATAGDPASYQSAGWLLLGIAGLAAAINQVMGAVLNLRKLRAPSPEETETDAKFAKVAAEIKAVEQRLEQRMGEHLGSISTRLQTMESSLTRVVSDFNYAVGRIDGQNSI